MNQLTLESNLIATFFSYLCQITMLSTAYSVVMHSQADGRGGRDRCASTLRCANAGDSSVQRIKLFAAACRPRSQCLWLIAGGAVNHRLCSSGRWARPRQTERSGGRKRLSSASSLPLFDSLPSSVSFLRALHLSSPPHYPTFIWPSSPIPPDLITGTRLQTQLLDLLGSPAVINPASTRQQWLLL